MATLVLTTAGTLLGGPIGGAIGAVLGNQIDRRVLAPKGRQGPRLGDLGVQTSQYGASIPRLFGTLRVAGTVIWATDLREDSHNSGGGKSGGRTTSYSYSASFAVALSARPIAGVGRIWADGKLLRGAAGDWKSETGFRLYLGDEAQAVDPLLGAAEGIDATPAHRGIAYAVFEGMQLADYANRIPSLTFEVIADPTAVAVARIVESLSDGAIGAADDTDEADAPTVGGYAASGDSVRGSIEALAAAYPMSIGDDGERLLIDRHDIVALDEARHGAAADGAREPREERGRGAADTLPDAIELLYYEPSRDFQAGLQRARRDGAANRIDRIELPAALAADDAKALAEAALRRAWARRGRRTIRLPWRAIEARAGRQAEIGGELWRIAGWSLERMVIALDLVRDVAAAPLVAPATPGRATSGDDGTAGSTLLALLDLPPLGDTLADTPQLTIAAAGTGPGWRRAEMSLSLNGGASWRSIGRSAMPATIGLAATLLGDGPATLVDRIATVDIMLAHDAMALAGADDAAMLAGANLALLGDELIQFGDAARIGPATWQLGRLLRGRRGSEWASGAHAIGDRFIMLDPATLLTVDLPLTALGATARLAAMGPGDGGVAVLAERAIEARALQPPSPIALHADRLSDGTLHFEWIRRSRAGWAWLDGADAPLGEDDERYRLEIMTAAGTARTVELTTPAYDYGLAEQAADGTMGAALTMRVAQLGTRAPSRAAIKPI